MSRSGRTLFATGLALGAAIMMSASNEPVSRCAIRTPWPEPPVAISAASNWPALLPGPCLQSGQQDRQPSPLARQA
jgi:hypothetical protein